MFVDILFQYDLLLDGAVLRQGNYLSAVADIGVFEQSLTTDLLNHLVFVQKVFMKVSYYFITKFDIYILEFLIFIGS